MGNNRPKRIGKKTICMGKKMKIFYKNNLFNPIWYGIITILLLQIRIGVYDTYFLRYLSLFTLFMFVISSNVGLKE